MPVDDVVDILSRIVSGEYTTEQVEHIRNFLSMGVNLTALIS